MSPSPFPRGGVSAVALAGMLSVDVATVERWHSHGRGPRPVAEYGALRFTRHAIERWLERLGSEPSTLARSASTT